MNVTDHEKFTHQASWSELLGDTIEWLPRPIAQDFHSKISMKCISQPIEASSFLRIIMCIKEGDLEAALKWINSTYETSRFPGALFLLRARVHFLLDQYEPMEQCLIAAQEVGEDLDQVLATTSELRDLLLKKIEPSQSAAICCDFNESEGDQDLTSGNTNSSMGDKGSCVKKESRRRIEKNQYQFGEEEIKPELPDFSNTVAVVCSVGNPGVEVLMSSISVYAPKLRLLCSVRSESSNIEMENTAGRTFIENIGNTFGESYNHAVQFAIREMGAKYVILMNDDIVLNSDSIVSLFDDYKLLVRFQDTDKLGYIAARSDYVRRDQNVRVPGENDKFTGLKFSRESDIRPAKVISPILALISCEHWLDFLPINWFSDDLQCLGMAEKGLHHYVSQSYVHHAGSQTIGGDHQRLFDEAMSYLKKNSPESLRLLRGISNG